MRTIDVLCAAVLVARMSLAVPDGTVVKRVPASERDPALKPLTADAAKPYGKGFIRDGEAYVCDNGSDAKSQCGVSWASDAGKIRPE